MVSRHSLKFCANLSFMFQEHEAVLQRYEAAGIAGFRGVEIDHSIYRDITAVEDIAERLQKYNLEQILINAYAGNFHQLSYNKTYTVSIRKIRIVLQML